MPRSDPDGSLGEWLSAEGFAAEAGPGTIAETVRVRSLLIGAARKRRAVSYSALLAELGHRFTRPKMRALCRTLDAIDAAGAALGEPGLAVLVVRESDGLPGQGWWVGAGERRGYQGAWTGAEAATFVTNMQELAFDFWSSARPDRTASALVAWSA